MPEFVQIERIRRRDLHERIREYAATKATSLAGPQLPLHLLSLKLRDSVATSPESEIPECTTCGACCTFAMIVPVSLDDTGNLSSYCDILLDDPESDVIVDRMLPRTPNGRCVNLQGELGRDIGCSIYPNRPHVCHDFEAGSDRCHEYRRMYGFESPLSEMDASAAAERLFAVERPAVIEDVAIVSTGKIERSSFSIADGRVENSTAEVLTIVAFFDDEEPHELHTFEYGAERWLESDLLGLTLAEAEIRIKEKAGY